MPVEYVTKQDFKRFLICFKKFWIGKKKEHLLLTETLIKAKKICVKNNFLTDLQHSPSDLGDLAPDDQLAENTQVLSEDFFSIYQHFGVSVGKLAKAFFQEQFATNYDLDGFVMNAALKMTPDLLNNPEIKVLFEPAFRFGRYQTRIDVLIRIGNSVNQWELVEVKAKSDRVFTSKGAAADRNNLLNDVAYQVFVLQKCGIKITKVSFLLLNHLFRKTKDEVSLKELFVIVSDFTHRKKTINFLEYCSSQYDNIEKTLVALWSQWTQNSQWKPTAILLNDNCSNEQKGYQKHDYHCPHIYPFIGEFGSVFDLSRGRERAFVLYYQYHLHWLKDINLQKNYFTSEGKLLKFTFTQKRQIEVAQDKNATLHRKKITDLMTKINQYKLPLYFYDFESVQTPVPYFIYTTPFQQIVFQYALYAIPMPNHDEEFYYYEYISPHADDFRLTIIDKLITDLFRFGVGKYVVYNKVFECQRLEEWADYLSYLISQPNTTTSAKKHYRVLSNKIQLIIENTLDLMEFFSRFDIYYLSFQGRYSIKKTLPALVENFSYQDLKVQKGDQASELFYRLLVGNVNQQFWHQYLIPPLLAYCKRDAWAMVLIWKKIKKLIAQGAVKWSTQ